MPAPLQTLRLRIEVRIRRRRNDAFLSREFLDLGGERQVPRALRELTEAGKLIRLGCGAYGRAEISPIIDRPLLAGDRFGPICRQVPEKLKVPWEPTGAVQHYNDGRGAPAPMMRRVRLRNSRFSRKLRCGIMELTFER